MNYKRHYFVRRHAVMYILTLTAIYQIRTKKV